MDKDTKNSGQSGTDTDVNNQFETGNQDLGDRDSNTNENDFETDGQGTVKYSTYKKAINQLKNQKGEIEELRNFRRQIEEKEMQKKGEYDKLLKVRDERINELEGKLGSIERDRLEGKKLNAFIDKLPGKIKKQEYLSFLDTDSINVDPESGQIDEMSLDNAVNSFVKNYNDLIQPTNSKSLPSVGHLGGKPNLKRSLKDLSREELRQAYRQGAFRE
jgi:hypothetical protein